MRRLFAACIAALLLSAPAIAAPPLPQPKLLAVYFYADWCANCKAMAPSIAKARSDGALDKKDVLFVTMNLTDKPSIHQSILLATALGIGDFLKAQGSATGYIALLDATTKKEITRFDRTSNSADIVALIDAAL